MILQEFYTQINEYGKHGFPGYGMSLFARQHYNYIASSLADIGDETVRMDLCEWFCKVFSRDNYSFKDHLFTGWVKERKRGGTGSATFQQRHFYYLAEWIKNESDPHRKEFLAGWLGTMFDRCNENFKMSLWKKFCGIVDKEDLEEQYYGGSPGFGQRGFGGYGQKIFTPVIRAGLGSAAADLPDPVVRKSVAEWLAAAFDKDAPNSRFNHDEFVKVVTTQRNFGYGSPRYQGRHYYYLAEMIKKEPDLHRRIFLCQFLSPLFEENNPDFLPSRWEDFCEIPDENREWKPEIKTRSRNREDRLDHRDRSVRVGDED